MRDVLGSSLREGDLPETRLALQAAVDAVGLPVALGDVLRPETHLALAGLAERDRRARTRLIVGVAMSAIEHVAHRGPAPVGSEERTAILIVGEQVTDLLDARMIAAVLERAGCATLEVPITLEASEVVAVVRHHGAELAIIPTSGTVDVRRVAPAYRLLMRLPDAPVIIACGLDGHGDVELARSVGADAHVTTLDAMLGCVATELPSSGRRWGLGVSRDGGDLALHPTGRLDHDAVDRLESAAESRSGSFSHLRVELGSLCGWDPAGARALAGWAQRGPLAVRPELVAGEGGLRSALRAAGYRDR